MSVFTNVKSTKPAKEGLDALIVGAGFSGVYHLYRLRKLGMSVKVFEAGSSLGGTWYWNCYPGARVDSDFCVYQFSMEELWKDWNYEERFPGWKEIRGYFDYMDKKLDLSRDISFDTRVVSAKFDATADRWSVTAHDGTTVRPRFLILCTGFSAKPYMPVYKGLESFEGIWTHTARWPQEGINLRNKRIAVIGTGASGVQVIQEAAREASQITVFQRTPCLALPLKQHKVDVETQTKMKEELYPYILRRRPQTFAGFHFDLIYKNMAEISPEEVMISFEELWQKGGFHFWLAGYADTLRNEHFNQKAYEFWRSKVLEKVHDPETQRKLAPAVPPYPIGAKRPCLEDDYYEIYNQPNVALIDVNENPIVEVTPKGIKTKDGVHQEFDIIVFATGFDAVTGGITEMDIRGVDDVSIGEKWKKNGLSTYLGLMTTGFPNMFFPFGPHGPTAFCNGPTCAEVQGGWVADCLEHLQKNQFTRIVPMKEAEDKWVAFVNGIHNGGLWNRAKTWYTGANIPGKRIEPLNFVGGVPLYDSKCKESAENGFAGFIMTGASTTGANVVEGLRDTSFCCF